MSQFDSWLKLYSSKKPDIRIRAANGILEHSDDAPLDLLIDILTSIGNHGLGAKVEKVLLKRKDLDLVPRMIHLLESNDQFVRESACTILGHSGDFSATPHLLRMLDDPKLMVRRAAGFGLAFLKDKSSITELRQQFHRHRDDDSNVISAIQCALRTLGEDSMLLNDEFSINQDPNDPISLYKACVHERLAEHCDGFPSKESVERTLEVLFLPSFHPETLVQVSFDGKQTMLLVTTMTSSVFYYEYDLRLKKDDVTSPITPPPDIIDEICQIEMPVASRFWIAIDVIVAAVARSTDVAGCDGISVRAIHRQSGSKFAFEAWSPESDSPQGLFVGEVFKLAWKAVRDKTLIERLGQIKGYL